MIFAKIGISILKYRNANVLLVTKIAYYIIIVWILKIVIIPNDLTIIINPLRNSKCFLFLEFESKVDIDAV